MSKVRRSHRLIFTVSIVSVAVAMFTVGHGRADAPVGRYTIINGTVLDNKTGLLWQRNIDAMTYTWGAAQTYCTNLNLDGLGWRVPSLKELQTIVDESKTNPAIDTNALPTPKTSGFWTSSPVAANSAGAWSVFFGVGGYTDQGAVTNLTLVRCVR